MRQVEAHRVRSCFTCFSYAILAQNIKVDMSIVGSRPVLFNQDDLITLRTESEVHKLTLGLTGWVQINGRDELPNS